MCTDLNATARNALLTREGPRICLDVLVGVRDKRATGVLYKPSQKHGIDEPAFRSALPGPLPEVPAHALPTAFFLTRALRPVRGICVDWQTQARNAAAAASLV